MSPCRGLLKKKVPNGNAASFPEPLSLLSLGVFLLFSLRGFHCSVFSLVCVCVFRDRPKNHDSQRRDRILRYFLRPEIGQVSPHFWALSLPNCTESPGDRGQKSTGRRSQKSNGENSPELQISVPCRGRTHPECFPFLFASFEAIFWK